MSLYKSLAINIPEELIFGKSLYPLKTRRGLNIGGDTVYPELNFTLPPMHVNNETFPNIKRMYRQIVEESCIRAIDLECEGLVIEFESLIEMTLTPKYSIELTKIMNEVLEDFYQKKGLKSSFRITPNDTRHKNRPPLMHSGELIEGVFETFEGCANEGAELLSIESTGGKEVHDDALMMCDIEQVIFSLAIMGTRDMSFLWDNIVSIAKRTNTIPAGDTACGFGNTAMILADKKMIPRIFATLVRTISVVRSLVAHEKGAVGPGKDCGYENPYLKAITGFPMSMEGKSSACAHPSPLGNIAAATCNLWSNESVQNIKLLGGDAPVVSLEQLIYDCRLMNIATKKGMAVEYSKLMVDSDKSIDTQALVLVPEHVITISKILVAEENYYNQAKAVAIKTLDIIENAYKNKQVKIPETELSWLEILRNQLENLPNDEQRFIERVLPKLDKSKFIPEDYDL